MHQFNSVTETRVELIRTSFIWRDNLPHKWSASLFARLSSGSNLTDLFSLSFRFCSVTAIVSSSYS